MYTASATMTEGKITGLSTSAWISARPGRRPRTIPRAIRVPSRVAAPMATAPTTRLVRVPAVHSGAWKKFTYQRRL